MAGKSQFRSARRLTFQLDLRLLGYLERIVDLDPQIPDGAFELRMTEKQLNRSKVLGPPID